MLGLEAEETCLRSKDTHHIQKQKRAESAGPRDRHAPDQAKERATAAMAQAKKQVGARSTRNCV